MTRNPGLFHVESGLAVGGTLAWVRQGEPAGPRFGTCWGGRVSEHKHADRPEGPTRTQSGDHEPSQLVTYRPLNPFS